VHTLSTLVALSANALTLMEGVNSARGAGTPGDLLGDAGIFTTIVNILLFIIGALAVIMIIIGGLRYAISGGDAKAVSAAKNTILYAIVGLIVAFLAFAAVNFVLGSLVGGGTSGTNV
jgi:hypothetical protein